MNFQVKLSAASSGTVTVKYATANGTAIAGTNYQAASGTLTFAPGETTKTVSIVIPSQNLSASKTFNLLLSTPTGATLADASGVGTIQLAGSPTPTPAPSPTPTPVNSAPVAVADSVWIPSASPASISVLANDTDPNGDKISVKTVTQGSFGTVSINPDGTVSYTPGSGFTGSDSFNYTIADVAGLTSTASVSVKLVAEGPRHGLEMFLHLMWTPHSGRFWILPRSLVSRGLNISLLVSSLQLLQANQHGVVSPPMKLMASNLICRCAPR